MENLNEQIIALVNANPCIYEERYAKYKEKILENIAKDFNLSEMTEETRCLQPITSSTAPCSNGEYVWTQRETLLHLQKYTLFFRLIDFVEKIRTRRFYEPTERFEIIISAYCLGREAPFCQNRRFPEEYWVNLSVGAVAEALNKLIASLDIPSPQLLSQMTAQDWDTWKKKFDVAMVDIRRLTYCTDLEKLADLGIYNRTSFEQRFNLQWRE